MLTTDARTTDACLYYKLTYESLDAGGGGGAVGLEFSNQYKFSPLFSFFKIFAYSLKIIHYSLKCR